MKLGSLRKVAIIAVLSPSAQSLPATNAQPALRLPPDGQQHSVTLTWKASSSHVPGYNVYRKAKSEKEYRKVNSSLVEGLTYTDNNVKSGSTYQYAVRSVDAEGHESINSQEFTVVIP